ncbi:MAG TPA: extracellular solute-binding protein [Candidatus Avacidaminococcus intestinavium]|uniref:Extracellular solute-binding protein n=1 Tax=Candidatus Avacidaminococcus intestinavium TaxID=2840684 RepID=A0A9D1MPL4_9FIRM|nr:extracellular solute-binding protein [Candidatus Avacidaminococcus intestinavium]
MQKWKLWFCCLPVFLVLVGCKTLGFQETTQPLRIYSELPVSVTEDFVNDFLESKEHKVKVEVVYPPQKQENSTINIVQNNYDIWLGATAEEFFLADTKKILTAYQAPNLRLPPALRNRTGAWTSLFTTNLVMVINKRVLRERELEVPVTWNDLQGKLWQDGIVLSKPKQKQSGYRFITTLWQLYGEEWLSAYLSKLEQTQLTFAASDQEALHLVATGNKAVTVLTLDEAMREVLKNSELSIVVPKEGTARKITGVAILAGTKQEELSATFIDYLLSKRAQNILDKSDYYVWPLLVDSSDYTWGHSYAETFLVQDDLRWCALNAEEIINKIQLPKKSN